MREKMRLFIALSVAILILLAGCIAQKDETNTPQNATATISELVSSPEKYLNKTVVVEATVRHNGSQTGGEFFLEDGNAKISVYPWLPTEVMNCPPEIKCSPPKAMPIFVNKRVVVVGEFNGNKEPIYNRTSQRWEEGDQTVYRINVASATIILKE